jgi:hypothetical protein
MGRPKGSKNKADTSAFVAAVERALEKGGIENSLVNLTCREIKKGCTPIHLRFLEMKYGKPKETRELTGPDGDALKIIIEHITA